MERKLIVHEEKKSRGFYRPNNSGMLKASSTLLEKTSNYSMEGFFFIENFAKYGQI